MNNEIVERIKNELKEKIIKIVEKSHKRIYLTVDKKDVVDAARIIFWELGARFITASGVDLVDRFEMVYHFHFDKMNKVLSLKAELQRGDLKIDSIAPLFKAAEWIEREIHELLGVEFKGHPDLKPLLSSEEWQPGEHPLRKTK